MHVVTPPNAPSEPIDWPPPCRGCADDTYRHDPFCPLEEGPLVRFDGKR